MDSSGKCPICSGILLNPTWKNCSSYDKVINAEKSKYRYWRIKTFFPEKNKRRLKKQYEIDRSRYTLDEKFRLKNIARRQVSAAILKGLIKKDVCRTCGTSHEVEAHHSDYSKPLEIVWLCKTHHRLLHLGKLTKEYSLG